MPEQHWYCEACGEFDGPKSGDVCDVCADGDVHARVEYMAPARQDERGKMFELRELLTGPGDPASLVSDALHYLAEPTAETDALVTAAHRYMQVDGSHGVYDAIELGEARRALIALVGEPERLSLGDLVAPPRTQVKSEEDA